VSRGGGLPLLSDVPSSSSTRLLRLAARDGATVPAHATSFGADELVALAKARDPRAAAQIWDQYAAPVRGVLRRTIGPDAELDDLVQEVFVGFFRNVGSLRDPSALGSFLTGIAIRTARAALRKRRVRRWLHLTAAGDVPEMADASTDPRAREAVRRLYAVLDELGARERLAFVLRYGEEYELTEVAAALECSLATAKRSIAQAEAHVLARARADAHLARYVPDGGDDEVR